MAIAVPQVLGTTSNTGAGSSLQSSAFGSTPTTGNTILVFVWTFNNTTVTSVTDNVAGNPNGNYTQDAESQYSGSTTKCWVFRASNITGGATFKITVQCSANTYITFCAMEVSGLANASPLDGAGNFNFATGTNQTITTGAFSTTNANDLIVATFSGSAVASITTPPAGFSLVASKTSGGTNEDGSANYQIVSSTQTSINPTWVTVSGTDFWASFGLAYKAAAAVAPGTTYYLGYAGSAAGYYGE